MCDISTLAKYVHRPSPPRPANNVECRGRVFLGNDGELWRSEDDSNGVYRWKKVHGGKMKKSLKKILKNLSPLQMLSSRIRKIFLFVAITL